MAPKSRQQLRKEERQSKRLRRQRRQKKKRRIDSTHNDVAVANDGDDHKITTVEEEEEEDRTHQKRRRPTQQQHHNDNYAHLDPEVAAALRREDVELERLEELLTSSKNKDRLHREYATQEGFGDDFGDFLDSIDTMVHAVVSS